MRSSKRRQLLHELERLGRRALFGAVSETYRTCGQPGCRCHHGGPKHGPHVQVSYRGPMGKTTGYHVPQALAPAVREGVAAWQRLQEVARELAELNREQLWTAHAKRSALSTARSGGPKQPDRSSRQRQNDHSHSFSEWYSSPRNS